MAVFSNKNSFYQHSHATPFCIETNPRENRIFASDGQLASKKGTHSVKFIAGNQTKQVCSKHVRVVNGTENMKACDDQRERLQGMLYTDNGNSFKETQK